MCGLLLFYSDDRQSAEHRGAGRQPRRSADRRHRRPEEERQDDPACHRSPTGRRAYLGRRQRDQARGALCGKGRMRSRIYCLVTDRMTSRDHRGHPRRHATLVILVITRKGDHGQDRPGWPTGEKPPAPYSPSTWPTRQPRASALSADVCSGSVRWVADPTRHPELHPGAHLPPALRSLSGGRDKPATRQPASCSPAGAGRRARIRPARRRSAIGSANFSLIELTPSPAARVVGEHRGPHRATCVHRPGLLSSYKISLWRGRAGGA